MQNTFWYLALSIAGFAIIWRTFTHDNPPVRDWLKQHLPKLISKSLLCGNCFVYWLSFAAVILYSPLAESSFTERIALPSSIQTPLVFLIEWFAIACAAVTIRFASVAFQELVHNLTHDWRKVGHRHDHSK